MKHSTKLKLWNVHKENWQILMQKKDQKANLKRTTKETKTQTNQNKVISIKIAQRLCHFSNKLKTLNLLEIKLKAKANKTPENPKTFCTEVDRYKQSIMTAERYVLWRESEFYLNNSKAAETIENALPKTIIEGTNGCETVCVVVHIICCRYSAKFIHRLNAFDLCIPVELLGQR